MVFRAAGYALVFALLGVSALANYRFGQSLGATDLDRVIFGGASVVVDVGKAGMLLIACALWATCRRLLSMSAVLLWTACVVWSLAAAVGFAASNRDQTVTVREAAIGARNGWDAKVRRAEDQLAALPPRRPAALVRTELEATGVPARIWRRTADCTDVTRKDSRQACAPVLSLRRELAAAMAAERLETELAAARSKLAALPVAGFAADPQAATLARLTGSGENNIRAALAILLATLIEAGSALGFTLVTFATLNPERKTPRNERRAPWSNVPLSALPPPKTPEDAISRWALTRLDIAPKAAIPARVAHRDFCAWCETLGLETCSETLFGRRFTEQIGTLGGRKEKRRDRSYYVGVGLSDVMRPVADEVVA